jgi:hypothetical protein
MKQSVDSVSFEVRSGPLRVSNLSFGSPEVNSGDGPGRRKSVLHFELAVFSYRQFPHAAMIVDSMHAVDRDARRASAPDRARRALRLEAQSRSRIRGPQRPR